MSHSVRPEGLRRPSGEQNGTGQEMGKTCPNLLSPPGARPKSAERSQGHIKWLLSQGSGLVGPK
eukprot:120316-Pyramimonas_sp.AAC.1